MFHLNLFNFTIIVWAKKIPSPERKKYSIERPISSQNTRVRISHVGLSWRQQVGSHHEAVKTLTFWRKRTILWTISTRCSSRLKSVRGVRMKTLVLPKAASWSKPHPCRSFFTASASDGRSWFGHVNCEIILYLEEGGVMFIQNLNGCRSS